MKKASRPIISLASAMPILVLQWHPILNGELKPNMVTKHNNKKAWWLGECGHEWKASISSITRGNGCSVCPSRGFQTAKASLFYFIQHDTLKARKVGISNSHTSRLSNWLKQGWVLHHSVEAPTGVEIHALEAAIKRWIKQEHNLQPVLTSKQIRKAGGWTETFTVDVLNNKEIIKKITPEWATLSGG